MRFKLVDGRVDGVWLGKEEAVNSSSSSSRRGGGAQRWRQWQYVVDESGPLNG